MMCVEFWSLVVHPPPFNVVSFVLLVCDRSVGSRGKGTGSDVLKLFGLLQICCGNFFHGKRPFVLTSLLGSDNFILVMMYNIVNSASVQS